MNTVKVSAERDYEVVIGCDWSSTLIERIKNRTRVAVIVSTNFSPDLTPLKNLDCEFHLFEVPDGEEGKSSSTLLNLWNWLGAAGFTRSDLIVGIGGGAVTDVTGYAAASWLRGINWIAIPTTIAGAVDAAIGGKTAINSEYGKNLIGAFHSPAIVLIDTTWFSSLSDRDFAAGLAEVVKTGFIADEVILEKMNGRSIKEIRSDKDLLIDLIERSVRVKASVVSADFKESFAREVLNYGHTLGHAIELHSKFNLRHGECVAIGMAFMARLQESLKLISPDLAQRHLDLLKGLGLPTSYERTAWPSLLANMKLDKKSRGDTLRFVTITEIGRTDRLEGPDEEALWQAYEKVSK